MYKKFKVLTLTGKRIDVKIEENEKVATLKELIEQNLGIAHNKQKLLLKGKIMRDILPISDFDLDENSVVKLGL